MTTIPAPLIAELNRIDDPGHRADRLNSLADSHQITGWPARARLIRLVADTEATLADPGRELATADDPAWDHDLWWTLAGTRDRRQRATLLQDIHAEWAADRFVEDSDVLLQLAETERSAADGTTATHETYIQHAPDQDDTFDYDAGLADVYARAGRTPPIESAQVVEDPPAAPTSRRLGWLGPILAPIVALAAVTGVAAPSTPLGLRFACACTLVAAGLGWFALTWWRTGR